VAREREGVSRGFLKTGINHHQKRWTWGIEEVALKAKTRRPGAQVSRNAGGEDLSVRSPTGEKGVTDLQGSKKRMEQVEKLERWRGERVTNKGKKRYHEGKGERSHQKEGGVTPTWVGKREGGKGSAVTGKGGESPGEKDP